MRLIFYNNLQIRYLMDMEEEEGAMSKVSATIPWLEGTEEDFKELREGLERMRQLGITPGLGDTDSEDDTEDDSDEDPGDDHPGERLLWAAQHNHLEIVTQLLDRDQDLVKYKDTDEYTALHRAAYSHHPVMLGQHYYSYFHSTFILLRY